MAAECRSCMIQNKWQAEHCWLLQGFWARLQNLYNVWRGYSHFVTKMDPIMSKPW